MGGEVDVGEAEVPKEGEGVQLQRFGEGEDGETSQMAAGQVQGVEGGSEAVLESGHDGDQPSLRPFLPGVLLLLLLFLLVFVVAVGGVAAIEGGSVGQAKTEHTQRHAWRRGGGGEEGGLEGGKGGATPGFSEGVELVGEEGGMGEVEFF